MTLEVRVDRAADAVYVRLAEGDVDRTIEINDEVLVDLDQFGMAVGIELLRIAAPIPVADLTQRCHVRSETVHTLGLISESLKAFTFTQGTDGGASSAAARQPAVA